MMRAVVPLLLVTCHAFTAPRPRIKQTLLRSWPGHGNEHLLPELRKELKTSVRLICEGGIASPTAARSALDAGADNVVVGTAITGVDLQVQAYCREMGG